MIKLFPQAVVVSLLAAQPDVLAVWKQVGPIVIEGGSLQSDDPCFSDHRGDWNLEVDDKNLFISVDGLAGPNCEEKQRHELTVFTRSGADSVVVLSSRGLRAEGLRVAPLDEP